MRFSPWAALGRPYGVSMAAAAALFLAGCSANAKLSGPSWNLTGGKGATPIPERPINANPPQPAAVPQPNGNVPVYRGGRDPVSGRAPTWGAPPQGFATQPQQSPPAYVPPQQPASAPQPSYNAPAYTPPVQQPRAPVATQNGARTVEVRPGQSLAIIASEQRVSIAALMQANNLRDAYVIPGQTLVIPPR
jgi:hypothetical protein